MARILLKTKHKKHSIMKIHLAFFFLLILPTSVFCQNDIKIFKPIDSFKVDLSNKKKNEIDRQNQLLEQTNLTELEKSELDTLLQKYGEVVGNIWDVIDKGCSWYCGGGNYKVVTSSELQSTKKYNYSANSANDLSYKTAWVEGKSDAGKGEFIEYYFKNDSPRITTIIISNGYQKNNAVWKNNNRVKAIKLHVNGSAFGILQLTDAKTDQVFKVGTLGHNPDGTDLVLRFEILEVYQGDKYNDTAITEIYFDGIDVH
ncbi:MAG: hypothetical protein AB8G22_18820, partial [Saprospiraceae bacterium]